MALEFVAGVYQNASMIRAVSAASISVHGLSWHAQLLVDA